MSSDPSKDELEAAYVAALGCASSIGNLLWCASGGYKLSPAAETAVNELLAGNVTPAEPLRPPCCPVYSPLAISVPREPAVSPDEAIEQSLIESGIQHLCDSLNNARGKISPVEVSLERVSLGPCETGAMVRSTAHRLAYDLAHQLWLVLRNAVPMFQLREMALERKSWDFVLDGDIIRDNVHTIRSRLRSFPRVDVAELKSIVGLEHAHALDRLQGGKAVDHEPEPRLVVSRERLAITLDGKSYGAGYKEAAFVEILSRHLGHWVEPAIFQDDPELKGERIDRIYGSKSFPRAIKKLIESKHGTGYKLTLPPLA
jgi:hypothetical protein